MTWAIKNTKTGRWLYGTDFSTARKTQRTSSDMAMLWDIKESAEIEFRRRKCGKDYKIVQVEITEVVD